MRSEDSSVFCVEVGVRKLTGVLAADWTFARVAKRKEIDESSRPLKARDEDGDDPKSQKQPSCSLARRRSNVPTRSETNIISCLS